MSDLILGVSIAPGTSNELGVRVEIMDVSSETLKSYPDPRDRKCYLNEDVSFEVLSICKYLCKNLYLSLIHLVSPLLWWLALLHVQLPGGGLLPERGGWVQLCAGQPQDLRQSVPRPRAALLQECHEYDRWGNRWKKFWLGQIIKRLETKHKE